MAVPDIAPYLLRDFDAEIADYRARIADLKEERKKVVLRETASERALEAAMAVLHESGLGIEDLFESKRRPIRTWITKQVGREDSIWSDLKSHFILNSEALPGTAPKKRKQTSQPPVKPAASNGATLVPGLYHNPYSKQTVKVDPQRSDDQSELAYEWCQVFGFMTVESWRINEGTWEAKACCTSVSSSRRNRDMA